jgi:hypothetical protein
MDDKTYHSRLIDMFEEAEEASSASRDRAGRDIDYYDGKQWTADEARILKKRGQPVIAWNRIREKVDYLQGDERNRRTRPQALPNTPSHEQDSHSATDALQFVCRQNRYDETRSRVWADLLKAGWGGVEVSVEQKTPNLLSATALAGPEFRVIVRRCQWDRMFWDPHSSEEDFSDASYKGMVIWMDREEAVRHYGEEAADVFDETVNAASAGNIFDDRPKGSWARAGKRQRIRVVLIYFRNAEGGWDFCEFTKGGILRDGPSPYVDEHGATEDPFVWRSAYVDRENNRYGVVRDMIDLQDEINKRRSKALHHFTARQTFGNQKFKAGSAENKKQLARPDGHIELAGTAQFGTDFGIIPTGDQAAGHFELLSQATAAFETMGPNAAMVGKKGGAESGRALLAQQQGGQVQMGPLTDALRQLDYEAYRKIWNRVRQFWTGETWIRVTDDDRTLRFVGLNESLRDSFGNVVALRNEIARMDVDIVIEEAPAGATLLDEQFEMLVNLKRMDAAGEIPFKAIIAAAPNLRAKQDMLRMIEQREAQPPNPLQASRAEAELEGLRAEARLKHAKAAREEAETPTQPPGGRQYTF